MLNKVIKTMFIQYSLPVSLDKVKSIFAFNYLKDEAVKPGHFIYVKFGKIENKKLSI
jgi:hypothetical protein